jgi:hypothetical protein
MNHNPVNLNINCEDNYYFSLYLKETDKFDIQIIPEYRFNLGEIYGFAVTKSIFIKNIFTIITKTILKSIKKIKIQSKNNINTNAKLKAIKKLFIKNKNNISSSIDFIMRKKIAINSSNTIYIGKDTILDAIDEIYLSELDDYTLNKIELKFGEGINLRVAKIIKVNDKNTINGEITIKLIKLYPLSNYDDLLLSNIDSQNLGELDGINN